MLIGMNATGGPTLQERYARAFQDDTGEFFAAITDPGVMLSGSIFARPIAGRAPVWLTLRTAAGIYDKLTFTSAAETPGRAYLDWTARALGLDIDGITVLTAGRAGAFTGIAIHHRPLGAVLAFSRELGRRLDGLIEPGHFDVAPSTTERTT
jgi:hypothetical protein